MSSVLLSERAQRKYFIPRFDREIPRAYNAGVRWKRRTLCDTENREVFGKMMLTDSPAFAVGMMLAGLAAGMIWYGVRLKNHRMPVSAAWIAALLGALLALICAKAGYLLHDLGGGLFDGEWDELTEICAEKLSFVGGCAGMIAGVVLAAKISGIRPGKALDLFAAPGCVFLCLARIAEGGMDTIGVGDEVEAAWLQFFPMTMQNGWGGAYLSVFVLEALTALVCLIPALQKREEGDRAGLVFERTAVCLLGAQIGWEMLLQYPYIRTFMTSFVSLEQVLCAVFLMVIVVRGCLKAKRWWPVPVTVVLLGISAFFQFFRDNKIELPESWEWAMENAWTISLMAFILISAALIFTGLKAVVPAGRTEEKN